MSVAVNTYPTTPYRQTPVAWPVKIFTPPTQRPAATILSFDWSVYFALMTARLGSAAAATNIAVDVDINSGATSQGPVLDKIVTAKIDNSNSYLPILIYFPDSGDVVTCPPQTVTTFPCTTNGATCKVIVQGLRTGNLPTTTITFYNYFIPPSVDPVVQLTYPQWLGSPAIQRGNLLTPGYASPALGDQTAQYALELTGPPNQTVNNLFGTPLASGFILLTQIQVTLIGPSVGAGRFTAIQMQGATSGQLYGWTYYVNPIIPAPGFFTLYNSMGKNLKLSATENWSVRNVDSFGGLVTGTAQFFFDWTYQPVA